MNGMFRDDYYDVDDIDHGFRSKEKGDLEKRYFNKEDELLGSEKEGFEVARERLLKQKHVAAEEEKPKPEDNKRKKTQKLKETTIAKTTNGINASSLLANLCRYFSFEEIQAATQDFDESLILGVGGFRMVYLGEIDDGK